MRISEIIAALEKIRDDHGDVEAAYWDGSQGGELFVVDRVEFVAEDFDRRRGHVRSCAHALIESGTTMGDFTGMAAVEAGERENRRHAERAAEDARRITKP